MKLLIIEDEISLRNSMIQYLQAQGYLCETVADYREALDKIDLKFYSYFLQNCLCLIY